MLPMQLRSILLYFRCNTVHIFFVYFDWADLRKFEEWLIISHKSLLITVNFIFVNIRLFIYFILFKQLRLQPDFLGIGRIWRLYILNRLPELTSVIYLLTGVTNLNYFFGQMRFLVKWGLAKFLAKWGFWPNEVD